ncbi:amino acid adenylation domain-containing protein [Spirillospora sp. NPDC048824]|uniref:amino acid adenylation domain-containing protein n=1 Tax=Spirillospora sp. NPDC048824 TaxID=3364526 RepID=UPI00371F992E
MTPSTRALALRCTRPIDQAVICRSLASITLPGRRVAATWTERLPYASTDTRAAKLRRRTGERPFPDGSGALLRVTSLHYTDGAQDVVIAAPPALLDETGLLSVALRLATPDAPPAVLERSAADPDGGEPSTPLWATPVPGGAMRFETAGAPLSSSDVAKALSVLGRALARRAPGEPVAVSVRVPGPLDPSLTTADEVFQVPFPAEAGSNSHTALREARLGLSREERSAPGLSGDEATSAELVLPVPGPVERHLSEAGFTWHSHLPRPTSAPLSFAIEDTADGWVLNCTYRADLFASTAMSALLDEIAAAPERRRFQVPRPPRTTDATIHALVACRAALRPHDIAVTSDADHLTYRQLDDWAEVVGETLLAHGVGPGHFVGVSLPRGAELIATLLGILKCGAAYVPIDPSSPRERVRYLIADSGVSLLVTHDAEVASAECRTLAPPVPRPGRSSGRGADRRTEPPSSRSGDPAYVIYTSGSTGRPKGVVVDHRNVTALLAATRDEFGFGGDDVWTFFHSYAFDFSVWEIWGCLTTGGRLVVVPDDVARAPEEFRNLLHREGVTVLNQTPSAFAQLLSTEERGALSLAVRLLVFGGESLDARILLPWFDAHPEHECRVVNMYGITETTVHCTWHTLTRHEALTGTRSIGRPLPGWTLHILGPEGQPLPVGVPGEIHVGGAGLARGYHRRPGLTARRFRPDDQGATRGARLYRSGDRGRLLHDGTYEHLGRLDGQVKVRGYRIELDEIRSRLLEAREVRAAAVVLNRRGEAQDAHLDAYVVGAGIRPDALRDHLAQVLPAYMVTSTITVLDELPLTGNGKLDPSRLPSPAPVQAGRIQARRTNGSGEESLHFQISRIWQEVLGTAVTLDDNFFMVGGNSLLAIRVTTRMHEAGLTDEPVRMIYQNPTVRRLAEALGTR